MFQNNVEIIHNVTISLTIFLDYNIIYMRMYDSELIKVRLHTVGTQTKPSLNFYKAAWNWTEKAGTAAEPD